MVFTVAFQALFHQTPQETAAVVTERGALVVVELEAVRHVDVETFALELREQRSERVSWL